MHPSERAIAQAQRVLVHTVHVTVLSHTAHVAVLLHTVDVTVLLHTVHVTVLEGGMPGSGPLHTSPL